MARGQSVDGKLWVPAGWRNWCEKLMEERLVVPLAEFDRLALAELRKYLKANEIKEPMKGKGRTRGENLVDHVKAGWTRDRLTLTLRGLLVWTPDAGVINWPDGPGSIASWALMRQALARLAEAL